MLKAPKRMTALALALILTAGQAAIPTAAAEEPTTTQQTLELPTVAGGETKEKVDVEVTVTTGSSGDVSATMTTKDGGFTTESDLTVEVKGSENTNADGTSHSEMTYELSNADGSYIAEGGTTTDVEEKDAEDLTIEVISPAEDKTEASNTVVNPDGSTTATVTAGETKTETKPTNPGDKLQSEDPANFDQTTTTTTQRVLEATSSTEFTADVPLFVDAEGNPVKVETTDVYNYYYGEIYDINNENINVSGKSWGVTEFAPNFYRVSVDENGNEVKVKIDDEKVCQRVIYDGKGTEDTSDDEIVNGLYCVDMSTGINSAFEYRLVNLEDAVEEGYYGEEDVSHLRAIMTHGYTWDDDADNGYTNLENIKTMITDAKAQAQTDGDTELYDLLSQIVLEGDGALSREQAATATGMAVWHYGNRFSLNGNETLVGENSNTNIQALYSYLITLTEDPVERDIITEEKFIDNMSVVIGDKTEATDIDSNNDGTFDNDDADDTNDVYNASVKFSMVVTPDQENDDLLVHIVNALGEVQKTVRIAGPQADDEKYEYISPEADGTYLIGGLALQENTDNVFNISLEGTQQLEAGVYVFESKQYTLAEAVEQTCSYWTSDANWEGERAWAASKLGIPLEEMTKEKYAEHVMDFYFTSKKYKNEDGSYNWDYVTSSQNFIGKTDGTAEVSANMNVTFNFNVDEATVTTTRVWRHEADPAAQGDDFPIPEFDGVPQAAALMFIPTDDTIEEEPVPLAVEAPAEDAEGLDILDEEVPLAAAPETGDASLIWGIMGLLSMAGSALLGKKKEEEI